MERQGMLSDEQFFRALRQQRLNGATDALDRPAFFFDPTEREKVRRHWMARWGQRLGGIIGQADKICDHYVTVLGFGQISLGREIDWHKDYISGARWEKKYYLDLDVLDLGRASDVKVSWEISRFHHMIPLGLAYFLTEEERYAKEFTEQVEDWIKENPPGIGVNWTCAMEVAIRAINWTWAYFLFNCMQQMIPVFKKDFLKSLLHHGRHVYQNLEFGKKSGNHLLTNGLGLLYLGILFPEFTESKKWLRKALAILWVEMGRQVYADGVHYEGAVGYHGLILEIYLQALILCRLNKIPVPLNVSRKFEQMLHFTVSYTKPGGGFPQIGDFDGGRVLPIEALAESHADLIHVAETLFPGEEKDTAARSYETGFWLTGAFGRGRQVNSALINGPMEAVSKRGSHLFPEGGFLVMRNDDFHLVLNLGDPGGRASGCHLHNDLLSFELSIGNRDLIVDSGTYAYTSSRSWRAYFRNLAAHNVLVPEGAEEFSSFSLEEPFPLDKDKRFLVRTRRWICDDGFDLFEGEHSLFDGIGIVHSRLLFFDKIEGTWVLEDQLIGEGKKGCRIYFHLAPILAEVHSLGELGPRDSLVLTDHKQGWNLALLVSGEDRDAGVTVTVEEAWYSANYGKKERNKVVVFGLTGELPYKSRIFLIPFEKDFEESVSLVLEKRKRTRSRLKMALESGGI